MALQELIDSALRRFSAAKAGGQQIVSPVDGLVLLRQDAPSGFDAALYQPVLCLILQGRKEVLIGKQAFSFGSGECLLVSHDLPVCSRIESAPYLALVVEIDADVVGRIAGEVAAIPAEGGGARSAVTHRADPALLDALCRFLALADSPADARVLAPLVIKEIHYRLLMAPFGGMLRCLLRRDSTASAIASAIARLRGDIRAPVSVPDMARRVGMSASSFHKHFKLITTTTPLQYQKELRLLEARRLLRTGAASVTTVAFGVGYESASQFSREYRRKFGIPPSHERVDAAA